MKNALAAGLAFLVLYTYFWVFYTLDKTRKNQENIAAIINCDFNSAYIGKNIEDMRTLFLQCLGDYKEMQANKNK